MSKIIEKAFDASKKIVRSIFRGSPNLITTSDLNRQLEALKYQVDKLDEKTGFIIEEANLGYTLKDSTLKVSLVYKTMEYKGCLFAPASQEVSTNFTSAAPYAYFCLAAEKSIITYEDDSTHEIAGAKFADGTSMRAADQIVYKNEKFVISHSLSDVENLVGVVAFFSLRNGNVYVDENWTDMYSPLRVKDGSGTVGAPFETSTSYPIIIGDNYDVAFGKIQKYLGDSTPYYGCWSYFHEGLDEITTDKYEGLLKSAPAVLIKYGPIYLINLRGLMVNEGISLAVVTNNLKYFVMAPDMDAGGAIIFKDLPESYKIGQFLGASIGISPLLQLQNINSGSVTAQQYIDSMQINPHYYAVSTDVYALGKGYTFFTFFSSCNYDGTKFNISEAAVANAGGMDVTLMFADRNILG